LQGLSILEEFPSELGTILWQSLRTVRRWASAPSGTRRKLFLRSAFKQRMSDLDAVSPEAALREPLDVVAGLLENPKEIEAAQIGAACEQIAEWAQNQNARSTAFEFIQAAALASPADPKLALALARAARDRAEYPVAEAWYQRTIALARRARDWDRYARAYIGLGKMWLARGVYPAARKNFLKAARVATRERLREPRGMAFHDLFSLEADAHHDAQAIEYAQAALRAYPPGHPELQSLAYALGFFWVDRGQFAPALPVLKAVVPRIIPAHQPYVQGGLARAAGGMGDSLTFEEAWTAVWAFDDDMPGKADALVEAARGAASLGRWGDAERAASRAREIASQRRQSKVVLDAEGVLDSLSGDRTAHLHRRQRALQVPAATPPAPANELAQDLLEALALNRAG
jgi:tetratricopeptide (TPR) repeat protein